MYERCKYCHFYPKGNKSCKCKYEYKYYRKKNKEIITLTPFRILSVSLTHAFYVTSTSINIPGLDYYNVFKHVKEFHPYKSIDELTSEEFTAQCYLVTHIIFTCNNWGELRLRKEMFPHEFIYLLKYANDVILKKDCHLAGEFLECLYSFGLNDEEIVIRNLIDFILNNVQSDGSIGNDNKDEIYEVYHATSV